MFEEMPARAKKRRKEHNQTPLPVPETPHVLPSPMIRMQQGIGILSLDVSRLAGSQRLGIIGLPGRSCIIMNHYVRTV